VAPPLRTTLSIGSMDSTGEIRVISGIYLLISQLHNSVNNVDLITTATALHHALLMFHFCWNNLQIQGSTQTYHDVLTFQRRIGEKQCRFAFGLGKQCQPGLGVSGREHWCEPSTDQVNRHSGAQRCPRKTEASVDQRLSSWLVFKSQRCEACRAPESPKLDSHGVEGPLGDSDGCFGIRM
jgi:hypothetical protein